MFAHTTANGRVATVWVFFLVFFWLAISQFRGAELLASLRGMWLGALLSWGRDREELWLSSDFSGATTRHGRGRRNFLSKVKAGGEEEVEGFGDGGGGGIIQVRQTWSEKALTSTSIFTSGLDKCAKHGFCINTQHFRGQRGDEDEVIRNNKRGNEREREGEPPEHEQKMEDKPPLSWILRLSSISRKQIAGMIAEHVPASHNEVQMRQVSSATHHHRLWPWEKTTSAVGLRSYAEYCRDTAAVLAARGLGAEGIPR